MKGWSEDGAKDATFLTLSLSFLFLSCHSTLSPLHEQEAASSFAQWEALMRGRGSSQEGDPFAEVMTLVTHMYKQTAIAKVTEAELILIPILFLFFWWILS